MSKNPDYSGKDHNVHVTGPTCFKYHLNHEFHNLNKNLNSGKNEKCSLSLINIYSLQDNVEKFEILLSNLEYQFDLFGTTETWHNDNNPSLLAAILPGHQKYESTSGIA